MTADFISFVFLISAFCCCVFCLQVLLAVAVGVTGVFFVFNNNHIY